MSRAPVENEAVAAELLQAEALYRQRFEQIEDDRQLAKSERRAAFARAHEHGLSYGGIGERVGLNKSRVIQIIKGRNR